jgi:superfamily II DNA or RNA helicase
MIDLFPYQEPHANALRESLLANGYALDASDTGTGKTAVASYVAGTIRYRGVLVVCPKAVKHSWEEWLAKVPRYADSHGVVNWEKVRGGNTAFVSRRGKGFQWALDNDCLIIFDECHMAKGRGTLNSKLVVAAKDQGIPMMLLSATPFQNPLETQALGYALGLHDGRKGFWKWITSHGCRRGRFGMEFNGSRAALQRIHCALYPQKASRMKISDPEVRKHFKDNNIIADSYTVDKPEQINEAYVSIAAISDLDERMSHDTDNPLTESLRARQKIELLKLPIFKQLVNDTLAGGGWPVVFLNFRDTAETLDDFLKGIPTYRIDGTQSEGDRALQIEAFQDSTEPSVMIATIAAGGVGVNLHDTHGERPRVSLISPTYNAVHFKQALGRIHRAEMRSTATQKIIFAANTVEEVVCRAVQRKLGNIETINNDDLLV